jgi:predicted TPR repeat methyltransferase
MQQTGSLSTTSVTRSRGTPTAVRRHGTISAGLSASSICFLAVPVFLGCGGGSPVASHLVARGFRVTGVDSSPTLIALCRSRLPEDEWIVADMRSLALGRRFEGILAWDSFFHLRHDDQRAMFEVFAAHAATGAIIMFNAGLGHGEGLGSYRGDPLYHASLSAPEYESLLAKFRFELIEHSVNDPAKGGRIVWLARSGGG